MTTRRYLLATLIGAAIPLSSPARAEVPGAEAFLRQFADQMIGIVNGPASHDAKRAALEPVIERNVDVPTIAKFCLGRFWSSATADQQQRYLVLFHKVLLNNIAGHLGEYRGVSYTLTGTRKQGEDALVGTIMKRPNAPDANVRWVVSARGGSPKVVDVVAEGTSLRLTQRQDYASYLQQNGNNIDALLSALGRQLNGS